MTAQYVGTENLTMTLSGPERILGSDGVHRTAYRLWMSSKITPGGFVYHLDSDFRVVRESYPCMNQDMPIEGYCDGQHDWRAAGFPAPYAIGVLYANGARSQTIPFEAGGMLRHLRMEAADHSDTIDVTLRLSPQKDPFGIEGNYTFSDSLAFPDTIETMYGGNLVLAHLDQGPMLAEPDWWPTQPRPMVPLAPESLYPGWDRQIANSNVTAKEAYEALLEESSEARSIVENGGCVISTTTSLNLPDFVYHPVIDTETVDISVASAEGKGTRYVMDAERKPTGTDWSLRRERDAGPADCSEVARSPGAGIDAATAYRFADELPLHTGVVDGFSWSGSRDRLITDRPAESGWNAYQTSFVPGPIADDPPSSYTPFRVAVDGSTGRLMYIYTDSGDLPKLDAGPDLMMPWVK